MIVIAVVVGIALALCVAGWVPVVRDAVRTDHVLPGPAVREAAQTIAAAARLEPDPTPDALSA